MMENIYINAKGKEFKIMEIFKSFSCASIGIKNSNGFV